MYRTSLAPQAIGGQGTCPAHHYALTLLDGLDPREEDHHLWCSRAPRARVGVGILLGRPAGEVLGAVGVPGVAHENRDVRKVVEEDLLELVGDLELTLMAGGAVELLQHLGRLRVEVLRKVASATLVGLGA